MLAVAAGSLAISAGSAAENNEWVVVAAGQARAAVTASAEDREPADELIRYVQRSTGVALSRDMPAPGGTRLLVGRAAVPESVRAELGRLDGDGFVIRTLPDGAVALAGNGRDGTYFAVCTFLEEVVGVRWLWPGELGEVVPHRAELRIGPIAIARQPAYVWRDLGPGGALWGPLDKWAAERKLGVSVEHQRLQKVWERRNRLGGALIYGGHAFGEMLPPQTYGPTHPEYYALVNGRRDWQHFDGKHGTQPCTTNPDVIRIVTEYARTFFDQHPGYEAFAISLNDGGGFCECDRCRALDSGKVQDAADDPEAGKGGRKTVITDRIMTFANEVATGVAKTHPDRKLILFAYGQYKQPPVRVQAHPNLIIQYTFHIANNWNPSAEEQQFRETGAWTNAARHLGIYEYFVQGNFPDLPRPMLEPMQRSVQRLYAQGYRYYQTQSGDGYAINGLNYYLLARLLWTPEADLASARADYFARGFGPGAAAVARSYDRLEAAWRALGGKSVAMDAATPAQYARVAEAYPAELRAACRRDLEEAAAVTSGPDRERVEFLQRGLRYVDLTVDAIEQTRRLLQAGWKLDKQIVAPAGADLAALAKARAAWEERDRFVETMKDDFVIAYFWVRYNEQNRTFVPLERMRAFSARQ